jgi:hypothetical protein
MSGMEWFAAIFLALMLVGGVLTDRAIQRACARDARQAAQVDAIRREAS